MDSPDREWRRLTENYAGMYDEELLALARDYKDLTEMAQQVLRDEMKKRGLGDPTAPRTPARAASPQAGEPASQRKSASPPPPLDPRAEQDRLRFAARYATLDDEDLMDLADDWDSLTQGAQYALGDELAKRGLESIRATTGEQDEEEEDALARAEQRANAEPDAFQNERSTNAGADYTWKTPLRDFETREEAWQRIEMLRRAKIDAWFEDPYRRANLNGYRVLVAADQLEEAQRIMDQPVPPDIWEQSHAKVEEFAMPQCPRCRAADPVLIDTEPSNRWLCESCGNEWTDPVPADAQS